MPRNETLRQELLDMKKRDQEMRNTIIERYGYNSPFSSEDATCGDRQADHRGIGVGPWNFHNIHYRNQIYAKRERPYPRRYSLSPTC